MYLHESNYEFGDENNFESFSQAINSCNSKLWFDAMKEGFDGK